MPFLGESHVSSSAGPARMCTSRRRRHDKRPAPATPSMTSQICRVARANAARTSHLSASGRLEIVSIAAYAIWTPSGSVDVKEAGSSRRRAFCRIAPPITMPHPCAVRWR